MTEYIKKPHTSIFIGQMGCGKTDLVLELIERNITDILTTSLSSAHHPKRIIKPIMLESGSKMMIKFGL